LPRDTENTNQMLSFSCSALEITNRNYWSLVIVR
jgi:hypothetical protein